MSEIEISIHEIIRSKRKTIALVITPDARLVIRSPYLIPRLYIQRVVEKRRPWIRKMLARVQAQQNLCPPPQFSEGRPCLVQGQPYTLRLMPGIRQVQIMGDVMCVPQRDAHQIAKAAARWYKKSARLFFQERTTTLARQWGYAFRSISIRSAKTRWGSCGFYNTLNFSWRLLMAPPAVIDYVVLHELVHTKIKDHSQRFWQALAADMPDYKTHRLWLKNNRNLLED